MENVHITRLTANVNNIQALSDRPNTADGLTSQELKEKFDKAGTDIKTYINDEMIVEIENFFKNCLDSDDSRLNNSRKCNNTFDNSLIARQNLKINYGAELPSTGEDGDIFFLY